MVQFPCWDVEGHFHPAAVHNLASTTAGGGAAPAPAVGIFSNERAGTMKRATVAMINCFMVVLYTVEAFGVGGRGVFFATGQRSKISDRVVKTEMK